MISSHLSHLAYLDRLAHLDHLAYLDHLATDLDALGPRERRKYDMGEKLRSRSGRSNVASRPKVFDESD